MRSSNKSIACALLLLAGAGCSTEGEQLLLVSGTTMGTTYVVKLAGTLPDLDEKLLQAEVDRILRTVDGRMSTYRPDSELSRFNASAGTNWFEVSPETREVVAAARRVSRVSAGAFDATVGPLVELWGFGPSGARQDVPAEDELEATLGRIGWELVESRVSPPALRKLHPEVSVDLGGIAKGFGVDAVARYLADLGVRNFLVEIGGELRARGRNAAGEPWQVAIEQPSSTGRSAQRIIRLADRAIATSGDYRNYFERDGRRYSHVIDPHTGRPVEHGVVSAVVLAPSAMEADAFATALMVLGPDEGLRLAEEQRLAVQMIVRTGDELSVFSNPAFEREVLH